MTFETHTLSNGLRLICSPSTSSIVYCGIVVDAGSRDELPGESGIAHFTEHLSFKGTTRRTAWSIINRIEAVGGELNAFTGKEETVYYCAVPEQHHERAIELLLDITLASAYRQRDIDKEAEVVADEIESYNDSPSELIYDDYDSLIFPAGHPLGRSILGEASALRQYCTHDLLRFASRLYRPERMVLYLYGNVPMESLVATARRNMPEPRNAPEPAGKRLKPQAAPERGLHRTHKDTHQAHVLLGNRCHGAAHPSYLPMFMLSNILGGAGMNSRLNMALRERRGLVYTVESSTVCYTDMGVWNVYFGCSPQDVDRCLRIAKTELQRLVDKPLGERSLSAAKRQMKGQLGISHDNHEGVAMGMGKRLLHYGTTLSPQELFSRIDALKAEDLLQTAREIINPDTLTILVYE